MSPPAGRPGRLRTRPLVRVVGIGLIGLLWLATGLALAELVVRVRPRSPARDAYVSSDPVRHHRMKPSHAAVRLGAPFSTNALGLKDREYPPVKPADVFRVLVIGDSFVEGFGLSNEDTMPKQAEALLAQRACRRRVEVVNGGVASYSPILEYLFLRHVGLALEPDLVVLAFDMTNVHDDLVRGKLASFDAMGCRGRSPRTAAPRRRCSCRPSPGPARSASSTRSSAWPTACSSTSHSGCRAPDGRCSARSP